VCQATPLVLVLAIKRFALDRGRERGPRARRSVEERRGRLASDHGISDRVGVLLVRVAGLADTALEADAALLLDDMRGLVRGEVQVGRGCERDVRASGECLGAQGLRGDSGRAADVGRDARDIVVGAERALDLGGVRERATWSRDAVRGGGMDMHGGVDIRGGRGSFRGPLDRRQVERERLGEVGRCPGRCRGWRGGRTGR
jgi:hypothetical protein